MKAIMLSLLMLLSTQSAFADTASYYHDKYHGRKTASGETFNQYAVTAASNKYKLGSRLERDEIKSMETKRPALSK